MRLVIDATTAQHARGGIGVVTAGLIGALQARRDVDVTLIAGPAVDTGWLRRVQPPLIDRTAARIAFQRIALPAVLRASRRFDAPGRLLLLDSYVPQWRWPGCHVRMETFIHDVLPLTHPEYFPRRKDIAKRMALAAIRRQRPVAFTSSVFTAGEIERELGVRPVVAEFGCGQLSDAEADALLSGCVRARASHVVYVGAIEPRKDLRTLVEGFLASRAARGLVLAIVGDCRTPDGRAFRAWAKRRAGNRIRFLGRLSNEQTRGTIASSRALIYPSLAEGFGLPVLEGMASGVPVITTCIPAIQSWALDGPEYFTRGDAATLAEALDRVLLGDAAAQIARGREISEHYRWARFAETILAA